MDDIYMYLVIIAQWWSKKSSITNLQACLCDQMIRICRRTDISAGIIDSCVKLCPHVYAWWRICRHTDVMYLFVKVSICILTFYAYFNVWLCNTKQIIETSIANFPFMTTRPPAIVHHPPKHHLCPMFQNALTFIFFDIFHNWQIWIFQGIMQIFANLGSLCLEQQKRLSHFSNLQFLFDEMTCGTEWNLDFPRKIPPDFTERRSSGWIRYSHNGLSALLRPLDRIFDIWHEVTGVQLEVWSVHL